MKKIRLIVMVVLLAAPIITGCAAYSVTPVSGALFTDVRAPLAATSNSESSKVGTAEAVSYFGLIATGDASIETAMKNGGITKIHHVDYHSTAIFGIYATFTVTVYGE